MAGSACTPVVERASLKGQCRVTIGGSGVIAGHPQRREGICPPRPREIECVNSAKRSRGSKRMLFAGEFLAPVPQSPCFEASSQVLVGGQFESAHNDVFLPRSLNAPPRPLENVVLPKHSCLYRSSADVGGHCMSVESSTSEPHTDGWRASTETVFCVVRSLLLVMVVFGMATFRVCYHPLEAMWDSF